MEGDDPMVARPPLAPGSFQVCFVDPSATSFGVRNADRGWFNFAAGKYEDVPFDRAKHATNADPDPDFKAVKVGVIPAPATKDGPFSVYVFKSFEAGLAVVQVLDYGVKGVPWIPPDPLPMPPKTFTIQVG